MARILPKVIDASLTDFCPNWCSYCSMSKWRKGDRCKAKFMDAAALCGFLDSEKLTLVFLSGGEPTEHPDFEIIKEMCLEKAGTVYLQTYSGGHKLINLSTGKKRDVSVGGKLHFGGDSITLPDKNRHPGEGEHKGDYDYCVLAPDFNSLGKGACWGNPHGKDICTEPCLQWAVINFLLRADFGT